MAQINKHIELGFKSKTKFTAVCSAVSNKMIVTSEEKLEEKRGIKFFGICRGKYKYKMTEKAYDNFLIKNDVTMEILFD